MKKYHICEICGREELFEDGSDKYICNFCKYSLCVGALNSREKNQINKIGTYGEFLYGLDCYEGTKCRNRLPNGRYCDVIPGRAKEISPVICGKCDIKITDNTLNDCILEDEYAIE